MREGRKEVVGTKGGKEQWKEGWIGSEEERVREGEEVEEGWDGVK